MRGKISIADRIALALALQHAMGRGWTERVQPIFRLRAASVPAQPLSERDGRVISRQRMLTRAGWKRRLRELWLVGTIALFVAILALHFYSPTLTNTILQWVLPLFVLDLVVQTAWSSRRPIEDRRVAAVRFLRLRPVRRYLRGQSTHLAFATQIAVRERSRRWPNARRRVKDVHVANAPGQWATATLGKCIVFGFAAIVLYNVPLPISATVQTYLFLGTLCAIVAYQSVRYTLVKRLDAAQLAGRCPDCDHDLRGVPRHPQFAGTFPDAGPTRCPECGVDWPLVPPTTTEEVVQYKPGT